MHSHESTIGQKMRTIADRILSGIESGDLDCDSKMINPDLAEIVLRVDQHILGTMQITPTQGLTVDRKKDAVTVMGGVGELLGLTIPCGNSQDAESIYEALDGLVRAACLHAWE